MTPYRELTTLEKLAGETVALLRGIDLKSWQHATRCPPLTVHELAVHTAGAAQGFSTLARPAVGEPTTDRVMWWAPGGLVSQSPPEQIVEHTQQRARDIAPEACVQFAEDALGGLTGALSSLGPDEVVGAAPRIVLTARELAAVAVVEIGIHAADLSSALGRGDAIAPSAVPLIAEVLQALLLEPPPSGLDWDPVTFILVASGRLSPPNPGADASFFSQFPVLR